jgi:glycosyltransferase involved in cell wall biosynthesis
MKILLMHPNFPAQFLNLCLALGKHPDFEIVYLTAKKEMELPGVRKIYFEPSAEPRPETHHYVHSTEKAVRQGQSAYKAALKLKKAGFVPDIVLGHSGWGSTLFMKDLFPEAAMIGYFEWFYHAHGSDMDFDPEDPITIDAELRARTLNVPFLLDLSACDAGICPTLWQQQQFPPEYRRKLWVCHDGVQCERLVPAAGTKINFPDLKIDLTDAKEVITYVGRGMERYRGFPPFMQAMAKVLKRRPDCQVVIVGAERIAYGGKKPVGYDSYKEWAKKEVDLDWSRVHFTGLLPRNRYLQVLQASSLHVYLTYPFVLSWSMLEAMSCGCLLLASDTPPVREIIVDGENGLLTDFFSVQSIAERAEEALSRQQEYRGIRAAARQTILDSYDWRKIIPEQVAFLRHMAGQVRQKKSGRNG